MVLDCAEFFVAKEGYGHVEVLFFGTQLCKPLQNIEFLMLVSKIVTCILFKSEVLDIYVNLT